MMSLKVINNKSILKQTGGQRKKAKICVMRSRHLVLIKRMAAELCVCKWSNEKQGMEKEKNDL